MDFILHENISSLLGPANNIRERIGNHFKNNMSEITMGKDIFRLGGLWPHFRPCDDTLENSSVQIFK